MLSHDNGEKPVRTYLQTLSVRQLKGECVIKPLTVSHQPTALWKALFMTFSLSMLLMGKL